MDENEVTFGQGPDEEHCGLSYEMNLEFHEITGQVQEAWASRVASAVLGQLVAQIVDVPSWYPALEAFQGWQDNEDA